MVNVTVFEKHRNTSMVGSDSNKSASAIRDGNIFSNGALFQIRHRETIYKMLSLLANFTQYVHSPPLNTSEPLISSHSARMAEGKRVVCGREIRIVGDLARVREVEVLSQQIPHRGRSEGDDLREGEGIRL